MNKNPNVTKFANKQNINLLWDVLLDEIQIDTNNKLVVNNIRTVFESNIQPFIKNVNANANLNMNTIGTAWDYARHFAEHNLDCGMYRDSFSIKEYPVCVPFDSLWKLRFSTYPFKSSLESGWSSKMYRPSEKQELFLYNNYNIRSIDENFFLDTSFWKLLSDVQDPAWIANYKSLQ